MIRSDYDTILTNLPLYSNVKRTRLIAEIDVLGIRENIFDVYEVKCSYRKTKAMKQLKRIRRLLPHTTNTYFYCGESQIIEDA